MTWKLLRLKPLKPYFFGKEMNFKNTNYASSEYFPQQTQLTGALRLYWMEQNYHMKMHKTGRFCAKEESEGAKELVGDANSRNFDTKDNLGKINFISPMFVLKTSNDCAIDALFEIPQDIVEKDCIYQIAKPKKLDNILSYKTTTILENYDVKKGFCSGLAGVDFWQDYRHFKNPKCIVKHDEVFSSYTQVGIGLEEDSQQVSEGMFYTKKSYNLIDDFELGVIIEVDEESLEETKRFKDGIITLGAENSVFDLKVSDIPEALQTHPIIQSFQNPDEKRGTKIVLLSDTIMENSINENAYFQIVTHKVPFKMMQSKAGERSQSHQKSDEKLLVPKGTIYYFDTPQALTKAKGAYAKMGFNQYLALN